MHATDTSDALMLLGGLLQGLVLSLALAAAVALLLKLVRLNASTRFALLFVSLAGVCGVTVIPSLRSISPSPPEPCATGRLVRPARPAGAPAARVAEPEKSTVAPRREPIREESPAAFEMHVGRQLPAVLTLLYSFVVSCLGLRLLLSYRRLRRVKRQGRAAPPELAQRFERWVTLSGCRRPVTLLVSADVRGPMAAGFGKPAVIIPESLILQLTGEQIDDIGLHELAHLRRYDDWTTLWQRLLRAVFFFHPAVHWICRELEFHREVACDDSVLAVTNAPKPYARSLAKIAETRSWFQAPILASGAAFRKPWIFRRIQLLLNSARDRRPRVSQVTFALVLLVIIGIASEVASLPAFVAIVEGGNYHRSRWTTDGRTIQLDMAGEIEFGDDDVSVVRMSPGALLRIEDRKGWSGRKIEIRGGDTGEPQMRYFLHGRERPLDGPGRAWLETLLPKIIREHGINAEARARRILDRNGADALFQEIDRISSDHSRRLYLTAAMDSGKLQTEDMRRALQRAGRLSSDHDKANLLIETSSSSLTPELRRPFFDAVETIHSDHDRQRVITKTVAESETDAEIIARAAAAIQKMHSDHDKAQALRQPPFRELLKDTGARTAILHAAASIHSDHEKAGVLAMFLEGQAENSDVIAEVMQVAEGIHSDGDKARVLQEAPRQSLAAAPASEAFFSAVRTISSDHDRARVLTGLLARADVDAARMEEICKAAQGINSDHEKANVLIAGSGQLPPACFAAVRSITSDNDKRRVLERVLKSGAPSEVAKAAIEAAGTISSDHDKAEVLICAAQQYPDEETRALVRKAAEGVTSDSDYRRITSRLSERAR